MESAPEHTLKSIFSSFAGGKAEMSNKEFLKANKDCGLIDKKYTSTDIDINFAKIKAKTSKTITFQQFEAGLKLASDKKGLEYDALIEKVLASSGPVFKGTKAEYNKFHDDKSLYTGVYAKGGPTNVDHNNVSDISQTCDRSGADIRGTKK